jgi:hypothetical protein
MTSFTTKDTRKLLSELRVLRVLRGEDCDLRTE